MNKYNPNTQQFFIKDSEFTKKPLEDLEGYVPKMFVKQNKDSNMLELATGDDFEYILKFSNDVSSHSENEHFFLWLSKQCDIKTSNAFLIKKDINNPDCNDYVLLSENFTNKDTGILHLKDILSAEQRKGVSLGEVYGIINGLPFLEKEKKEDIKLEIFKQVLYSNSVGNYDLHYGNMAFLTKDNNIVDIAPAYDLTTTYIFDSYKKSNIIINSKKLDVTATDIIRDSMPYIDNKVLFDTVANITFKLNENFKEIKNSYIPQIDDLKNLQEIDILSNFYVEDELKDSDMVLVYKHIQNKIHSLNNICRNNGYVNTMDFSNAIIDDRTSNNSVVSIEKDIAYEVFNKTIENISILDKNYKMQFENNTVQENKPISTVQDTKQDNYITRTL